MLAGGPFIPGEEETGLTKSPENLFTLANLDRAPISTDLRVGLFITWLYKGIPEEWWEAGT
jgi:hypothetical protein